MPPNFLVQHTFLGRSCVGGVNPELQRRLVAVEQALQAVHAQSGDPRPFFEWCEIREDHKAWRPHSGHHSSGSALDINYTTCPYIVTRTGAALGGEAGTPNAQAVRQRAVDVYDTAVRFRGTSADAADVSIRVRDTIEVTYDRFHRVSKALEYYFGHVIWSVDAILTRPVANLDHAPDGDPAFAAIPLTERLDEASGVAALQATMNDPTWQANHPGWPLSPAQQYWQLLRDFEALRVPFLIGNPAAPITTTRNPSIGFLDLRREVVVALVNTGGLRWGACDFGVDESGDVMHFDREDDGGYPQVHS